MIQILGLRDYKVGTAIKKRDCFHEKGWGTADLAEIFKNPEKLLTPIPESDRWNLYFTVADCLDGKGRQLREQHCIPFDIDHIEVPNEDILVTAEKVTRRALQAIDLEWEKTAVVFSGNGVQFFVRIEDPILSPEYFETFRPHYKVICDRIQAALVHDGLPGKVDSSVLSPARLMRMPLTENRKPNKTSRVAQVLSQGFELQGFDLVAKAGIAQLEAPDQLSIQLMRAFPTPDTPTILAECEFLKWCAANQADVKEDQWYAMISVVHWLENGTELAHQMSQGHPKYTAYETDLKIEQAKRYGPRTCKDIDTRWNGCKNCKHHGQLTCPIQIRGPSYIKTRDTGFRLVSVDKEGRPKPGRVCHEDLIKFFSEKNPYVVVADHRDIYVYTGTHWVKESEDFIKQWAHELIKLPTATSAEVEEFLKQLRMKNVRTHDWLTASNEGAMNFQNGVLDLRTMTLKPHSPEYGFTYVLSYAYDPRAVSPIWDKFILDMSNDDVKLKDMLEEFAGYAIMGGKPFAQKALVIFGTGSNGKSVYQETLVKIVGDTNVSSVNIKDVNSDTYRASLVNKLFNYSEETGSNAFKDADIFKTLITGGAVIIRELYKQPYMWSGNTKYICSANSSFNITDVSHGFFRRFVPVHLTRKFEGDLDDKDLKYKIWERELPGVCNKLIAAFKRLEGRKYRFDMPESSINKLEQMKNESNSSHMFLSEKLIITGYPSDRIFVSSLHEEYCNWCTANREYTKPTRLFNKDVEHYVDGRSGVERKVLRIGDKTGMGIVGCKLITEEF